MREYKEEEILQIAKRQGNKKRKYLLVDPLQAKHIPVSPRKTLEMFTTLGEKLLARFGTDVMVIAFAETATALGSGVARAMGASKYVQTTRENVENVENWLYFEEEHSHATEQKISRDYLAKELENVSSVIIVDDEISTGKTLLNIVKQLREALPAIEGKTLVLASVINRVSEENYARLADAGIVCECLLRIPERDYDVVVERVETHEAAEAETKLPVYKMLYSSEALPDPRARVDAAEYEKACRRFAEQLAEPLAKGEKILVLGTEECMYPALTLARRLEKKYGKEVYCHATTRSPIGVMNRESYPIQNGCKLRSFYEKERDTYLYDLTYYDEVVVVSDATDGEESAKQLFSAFEGYGCNSFVYVKIGKGFSSYKKEDVTLLLKDVTGMVAPESTEVRERKIQSGTHYCEMLPIEHKPSEAYFNTYQRALEAYAPMTAQSVAAVAEKILKDKGERAVIVSLARAGTPIGILIKRYVQWRYGMDLPHYTLSIIRGRGIDHNAMAYILSRHAPETIQFVDGWTGKGAIQRQLAEAMQAYPKVSAGLAVLSDPAAIAEKYGTREDFLIASSCLNSTVSGLLSRTFLRGDIIGEKDFHGAVFYRELQAEDVSYQFIDAVAAHFPDCKPMLAEESAAQGAGLEEVKAIAAHYGVTDLNLVKPSIGEATRVLLRRLPERLLVHSMNDEARLGHLYRLAEEKGVSVEVYPLKHYRACGIIRSLADT